MRFGWGLPAFGPLKFAETVTYLTLCLDAVVGGLAGVSKDNIPQNA